VKLRWLWLDHVPPEVPLTRAERKRLKYLAGELRERHQAPPRLLRLLVTMIVIASLAGIAAFIAFAADKLPAVVIALGMIAFVLLVSHLRWRSAAPYVRLALRSIGHEVCVECGHLLRGLAIDTPTCPECGEIRRLMVRARRPPGSRRRRRL
jgi:hypothetical protein